MRRPGGGDEHRGPPQGPEPMGSEPTTPERTIERVLFREDEIVAAIDRVAADVAAAFGAEDFTVVSVLKGSFVFAADLVRRLPGPLRLSFAVATSYRDGTAPGPLELEHFPPDAEVAGRSILLVDDILDTGRTLLALHRELLRRGARDVRTCVFLDKRSRRENGLEPDFRCFEVEDVFVVGYGLDHAGLHRNLPYVAALGPEVGGPTAGGTVGADGEQRP